MGDSPTIPWRLLDIEILVEDHETGGTCSTVAGLKDLIILRFNVPVNNFLSCQDRATASWVF